MLVQNSADWVTRARKKGGSGDMRAQAGLTAADSQPRPILPQKPASDYQIHYIIRVLLLQKTWPPRIWYIQHQKFRRPSRPRLLVSDPPPPWPLVSIWRTPLRSLPFVNNRQHFLFYFDAELLFGATAATCHDFLAVFIFWHISCTLSQEILNFNWKIPEKNLGMNKSQIKLCHTPPPPKNCYQ